MVRAGVSYNAQCHPILYNYHSVYIIFIYLIPFIDVEDPVITGTSPDKIENTDSGRATAMVTFSKPSASDNSGTVDLRCTHTSPFDFPIGVTMVMYTATDPSSNTATTSFSVTVNGKHDQKMCSQ